MLPKAWLPNPRPVKAVPKPADTLPMIPEDRPTLPSLPREDSISLYYCSKCGCNYSSGRCPEHSVDQLI